MAKGSPKQSKRASQAHLAEAKPDLAEAVREVASAIRHQEKLEFYQRRIEVGKHLMMLGNLAASALVFGQAFSGFPFNLRIALLGVVVLVLTYVWAIKLMRGGDR